MKKYSFATGGFCFHLTQISNNFYQDQNGSNWEKKGNKLFSDGGNYIHELKPEDTMGGKDLQGYMRQQQQFSRNEQERFYHDRLLITKGFTK